MTLKRTEINVDSVLGDSRNADDSWNFHLAANPEIGYIPHPRVRRDRTAEEMQAAKLKSLEADKLKGLVIDLRGDRGGRLDTAIDVASLFIPAGETVVTTRGRDGKVQEREVTHGPAICTDVPMVVLIDAYSASASEIVSACLQDYQRAVICGTRSFGKGTVQRIISVKGNGVLKLTTATFWRPNNKNIHRHKDAKDTDEWGVMPDKGFVVKMSEKETEDWLKNRQARARCRPPSPTTGRRGRASAAGSTTGDRSPIATGAGLSGTQARRSRSASGEESRGVRLVKLVADYSPRTIIAIAGLKLLPASGDLLAPCKARISAFVKSA